MENMPNNKKLIYLFFDKAIRIAGKGETKIFPGGQYIATEDEYNEFDLKKYKKITLSFVSHVEIVTDNGNKQIFDQNVEYSMPKYKFDKLEFSRAQWGELTCDCVLKNVVELPFNAFNCLDKTALDRIGKIFFDDLYKETMKLWAYPELKYSTIKEQVIKETKKYEEDTYTCIVNQRSELIVFFNICFLYEKLIIDKSQNVFKIGFKKYVSDIKDLDLLYLYEHCFYKFFCNIQDDSGEIVELKKKPNEILLDFIGFFFGDNLQSSNLALICLCIDEIDSDYLTSKFFSGEQNVIQKIYDALFEDGNSTCLARQDFSVQVKYKKSYMPLCFEFFCVLISKLKYKTEYKDKFLELISFGGYKNYDGEYEIPDWENKLEFLRFVDPNFIRDNLDNNLVQKYLKTALVTDEKRHEDCLKKIANYDEHFHGNLKSEKDYLLKLVELGCIGYIDTEFIFKNIGNTVIQCGLSKMENANKQADLFNYFYGLYNDENEPEEIEAIDKNIDILMNNCKNIICNLDAELIVNDLNKSYIRNNIYLIDSKYDQQKICNNLYNRYQNTTVEQNEQKRTIIENIIFLIQTENWKRCINYFDNDFIVEILFGEYGDTVTKYFKYIEKEKAKELCSKLCEKYENSTEEQKGKCERYIIELIKTVKHNSIDYHNVASYLSGKFVLDHLEADIIKKEKPHLISETCQYLCSKYSENQEEGKKYYKDVIINLLNENCLDARDLSVEFIVECAFESKWLKKIDASSTSDEESKIRELAEYLYDKYQSSKNEMDKSDCANKIFKLIGVDHKAVCYLSVEFIAENFDTNIIKNNLKEIKDSGKQKELYDYFYDKYNKAKNDKNDDFKNINKNRIIKLINERKEIIVNADIDIEFICENWGDVFGKLNALNGREKENVIDKVKLYLKDMYLFSENNEPDFEKQEKNKDEVFKWIQRVKSLINFVHPKFIAENLQQEQILQSLKYTTNEKLNSLYDFICESENYDDETKKGKVLVLIKECTSSNRFTSKRFLYDNFGENIVQGYMLNKIKYSQSRLELWKMLYKCYLSDKDKEKGKQKLLRFIETCDKKLKYWDGYDEIDIPFVCDCLRENIIQKELLDRLIFRTNHNYSDAKEKMEKMFKYICEAQEKYELEKVGKDRTADILKLIDIFSDGIQYVSAEFIYNNFNTDKVKENLCNITASQGKQLVDCIKKKLNEEDIERDFLTLINKSNIFENYIDMKWIYEHLDNKIIRDRLCFIQKKKYIQELYDCIVTSEKTTEQKTEDILVIADSYESKKELLDFFCVVDAKFNLDNLDNNRIKKKVELCLSSDYDFGCSSDSDLARKFVLRKLICTIELVQDKSEQDKLYLQLLKSLNFSTNVFRYTSAKFLEDRVDSENEDIKKYIAENISVRHYQYEYGKNAETIKKSEDIKENDQFVMLLFNDISENNKDDNKFLEEALKYIKAYEIHDLSSLAEICGDMSTYLKIWDVFTKFIDKCKTYDSNFFGKLLEKTDPDENLALKLIDSKYFLGENASDKESCLNFFGRVLKSVDKYDDDYYKNFVCKLIEIDSKFVTENINKKFLAANCERVELKKLINPKEENYALTEGGAAEMFKYLDPEQERDKKIILEQINLDAIFCRWVSDEFLIENWNNENIQREITRRITKPVSIKGENGLFNFLDVIEKRTDLDTEGKKQASLKLLSFDKSGYKLIDDKRNLDFVIDNIDCKEIQAQLKKYLQGYGGDTDYKRDILPKIQTKTEKDGWDEKRREHAILILISCDYCAAANFIDIKFLMSHDEGRAAIKDQVFRSEYYESEGNIFNRVLKYLKRKTEKDGWSDKQKKNFISDLILNGKGRHYTGESIAFNLKNPIVLDSMKDHLNPDDEIFKSLIDYLNKGYNSLRYDDYYKVKRKYFEDRIFYLISLKPEFVIDYVHPNFLFNNRQKDLVKSGLKKHKYNRDDYFDFIFSLISCNPNLIKKPFYVKSIIDGMQYGYGSVIKTYLRNYFGSADNFGYLLFVELENQLYSSWDKNFAKNKLLELISLNPKRVIEWMISDKDNHYDENAKFLVDCLDDRDVDDKSKSDILNGLVMLCTENENDNGIRRIFDKLTNKILNFILWNLDYSLASLKNILCDKKNSAFLQKYLVYINQLEDSEDKNKILKLLKEWNINLGIQTISVDKNNLIEKEIQESTENINSAQNLNPEIDSSKNKNNKEEKTEGKKGFIVDKDNVLYFLKSENNTGNENTGGPTNNDFVKQSTKYGENIINLNKNPGKPNLFKAKILHNPLAFAIGFIILSILFDVIGFVAKITLLYVIGAVVLFVGIVFLLAWSIKKYRKKSNDIRKINVLQNDYPEETQTKENIRSEYRSNESEINTKSPTQIPQNNVKE